jgi:hypothetical protein
MPARTCQKDDRLPSTVIAKRKVGLVFATTVDSTGRVRRLVIRVPIGAYQPPTAFAAGMVFQDEGWIERLAYKTFLLIPSEPDMPTLGEASSRPR